MLRAGRGLQPDRSSCGAAWCLLGVVVAAERGREGEGSVGGWAEVCQHSFWLPKDVSYVLEKRKTTFGDCPEVPWLEV